MTRINILNKDVETMKLKFKSIDMLLLDDVQFLAGKDRTNEVFFQIFNNLFNEKTNRTII